MPHDVLRENQRELHGQCTITSVAYTKWGSHCVSASQRLCVEPTSTDPDVHLQHRGTEDTETQRKT